MIPCPANVKPGMKLVLNKNQEGVWRIAHAKEATAPPAKFALPESGGQEPKTPPPRASAPEAQQTPCWAEPRQEQSGSALASTNGYVKDDSPPRNGNAPTASPTPSENGKVRNRQGSRLGGSRGDRSASPKNPNSSRDSRGKAFENKSRMSSSPGLSGRTPNAGARSPSGNRRSLTSQTPADSSSRSLNSKESDKFKDLIRGVYQRKNPAKLAELDALLEKHKGDEKGIYEHVCRKYGETPRPWSSKP
jgi:hypothetical protein